MQKSVNLTRMLALAAVFFVANIVFADWTTPTAYWKLDSNGNDSAGTFSMTSGTPTYDTVDHVNNSTASGIFDNGASLGVKPALVGGYDQLGSTYAFSLSFWFKWTSTPTNTELRTLVQKWGGTSAYSRYFQVSTYGDDINFTLGNVYNNAQTITVADAGMVAGTWYHFAVTVDSNAADPNNVVKMYLTPGGATNLVEITSSDWNPSDGSGGNSRIINARNDGWVNVGLASSDSKIDEVRLYKQQNIGDSGVQSIYTLENIVPEPTTVGLCILGSLMLLRRKK